MSKDNDNNEAIPISHDEAWETAIEISRYMNVEEGKMMRAIEAGKRVDQVDVFAEKAGRARIAEFAIEYVLGAITKQDLMELIEGTRG